MRKNFVLDTNVLLHDPSALNSFGDNTVCIPINVIEELDQFKKDMSELGRNARQVCRMLDEYRTLGNLREGVALPSGGRLLVAFSERPLPKMIANGDHPDNRIVATALDISRIDPQMPTIFVTKDTNLRIRADVLGLTAEDYDQERIELEDLYPGASELDVHPDAIRQLYADGRLERPAGDYFKNEYLMLRDESNPTRTALCRVSTDGEAIEPITHFRDGVWGIRPRNREQHFALDLLLRDDIKMATLVGKAGTGKTLLAIAAGLQKTTEESVYAKLLVSRPIFPLGRDIGYLPGDIEEKLNPWMQPIYDNVEFLLGLSKQDKKSGRGYHELFDLGIIAIEPLTYIRGRSIPSQYMIIDEAQNLTPHEVKTILTRVGHGTKIVFTGDPYQIDNPYVDSVNNGLTYLVEKFKQEGIAGHVTLYKGERSDLAELAANLL
ncbi:MAG: PhoH family protein [Myxococcales bacterium]|nr:PhoH family protein [Myxococcales bacterium]